MQKKRKTREEIMRRLREHDARPGTQIASFVFDDPPPRPAPRPAPSNIHARARRGAERIAEEATLQQAEQGDPEPPSAGALRLILFAHADNGRLLLVQAHSATTARLALHKEYESKTVPHPIRQRAISKPGADVKEIMRRLKERFPELALDVWLDLPYEHQGDFSRIIRGQEPKIRVHKPSGKPFKPAWMK